MISNEKIEKSNVESILPLSDTQTGLLYHYLYNNDTKQYHEQLCLKLDGAIDVIIFQKAVNYVVDNNQMLRSIISWEKTKNPVQIILKNHTVQVDYRDISRLDDVEKEKKSLDIKEKELANKIDINKETLRIILIKLKEKSYELIISNHHILYDGWSNGIIIKELFDAYNKLYKELELEQNNKTEYKEFLEYMKNKDKVRESDFWTTYLSDIDQSLSGFESKDIGEIKHFNVTLNDNISIKLKEYTKNNKVSLATTLYTIWSLIMSKIYNQDSIIYGTAVSGRPENIKEVDNIVGLFINTIPLKVDIPNDYTIKDLLQKINNLLTARKEYENTSLTDIKQYINEKENIFNSIIAIENYPIDKNIEKNNVIKIKEYEIKEQTNYNMSIEIMTYENIAFSFSYNSLSIDEFLINNIGNHINSIVNSMLYQDDIKVNDIEIISEEEKEKILYEFNNTSVEYSNTKTLQQLFEEQVSKTPENIAVVHLDKKITYYELNQKSNKIAALLRQKGVKPNDLVGIMMTRSIEFVVGVMAIIKSGGAYMPIDTAYPEERIAYILNDSCAKVCLVNTNVYDSEKYANIEKLLDHDTEFINVCDIESGNKIYENPNVINSLDDTAYTIYTSGTTGNPKGAMVPQKALLNLCFNHIRDYDIDEKFKSAMYVSLSFDVSVWDLWPYILVGASAYVIDESIRYDVDKLNDYFNENDITIVFLPTQVCEKFLNVENSKLKILLAGGEKLNYYKKNSYRLINNYGPTETTVYVTKYEVTKAEKNIPIGKPVPNSQIYIVNNNKLSPIGVPGEICIAGLCVAKGYVNNEKLTKEKFVKCSFDEVTNPNVDLKKHDRIMYKTGDIGRWLPDGNIQYLGRIDNQVKIRGFRVELGEIKNKILENESIKEAVVVVKTSQNNKKEKNICAYVVCDNKKEKINLKEYLKDKLPAYMIPSYIEEMESLPLTVNGKIDKKALPNPKFTQLSHTYEAPRSKTEEILCDMFKEILEVEQIGITDDFFELGGHSLKVMSLTSRIRKTFEKEIQISQVFETPTIKELAEIIDGTVTDEYATINKVEEKEFYETSSSQKRIYMLQQFDKNSTAYNMPAIFELNGNIDKHKLVRAFEKIIKRHEAFRTNFELRDGEIVQKISQNVQFTILEKTLDSSNIHIEYEEFVQSFDLSKAPLIRVELINAINAKEKIYLLIDMHHIISDGMSVNIIINEFNKIYNGENPEPIALQYKDYAVWQNKYVQTEVMKKQEEYWVNQFYDEIPVLTMPLDYERPIIQSFEGQEYKFEISNDIKEKIKQVQNNLGITTHMFMVAALNVLLSKYSGEEDIVVGTPISGRPHSDLQNIVGMFVNTLALRNKPTGSKTISEFMEEVKQNSLNAYQNQNYQFDNLVEKLDIKKDTGRNPLFDIMLNIGDTNEFNHAEFSQRYNDFSIKALETENKISKFDMTFNINEQNQGIQMGIEYCTELFNLETIIGLSKHLVYIIEQIINNINLQIKDIELATEKEKNQIIKEFNNTSTIYPKDKTINQLFEEQSEATPDNIAVVFEDKQITYKELNEKSNRLAHVLRSKGVKPNDIIAIQLESSIEIVIAMLGVIKAGGAYLTINTDYPENRINHMLSDSDCRILITYNEKINYSIDDSCEIIDITADMSEFSSENLTEVTNYDSLVYVIYTSGTTGKPKGVMVKHVNVVRLVKNQTFIELDEHDSILQTGSMSFDASTFEVWASLLNGLKLCLAKKDDIIDINKLEQIIIKNKITTIWLTSGLFNQIVDENYNIFSNIKNLLVGGDVLSKSHINKIRSTYKDINIINGYGPTENTTFSTTFDIKKTFENNIPIGKPISNSKAYIIDKYNKLCPVGVYGELCVAGDGLSKGYLNNKELTESKFVINTFAGDKENNELMYKTGDLARWTSDGNIEFLGRIDNQTKIRGFRIELEEIENLLLSHENVQKAIVLVKDAPDNVQNKYICAYIVSSKLGIEAELQEYLRKSLPEYMIPQYFIKIDNIPLTRNGKVDKRALPEPDLTNYINKYEAPTNEVEQKLCKMFEKILEIEKVGLNDSFFELGGHSLKAMTLISQIHKEFNKEVPVRELFIRPTIKEIAKYIDGTQENIFNEIKVVEPKEYYETSSAQKRMYMLQQFDKNSTAYNIPVVLELQGNIDKDRIEKAFNILIERHEAFRTYFDNINGEIVQKIEKDFTLKLDINKEEKDIKQAVNKFIRPFDLQKAPLFRIELVGIKKKTYLLIDMHHIISDGMSMSIMVEEFSRICNGENLEPLRIQYKDFATWQNVLLQSEEIEKQQRYWINEFSDDIPVLNMPLDFERPAIQSFEGRMHSIKLTKDITEKIKQIEKHNGMTTHMFILTAINILLSKYTGQEDIVIGTPVLGRPHADLQNIMGMFVNTLALRNKPVGSKTIQEFMSEIKENSINAYQNQYYQFDSLVEKFNIKSDTSRNPLFDVMLNISDTIDNNTVVHNINSIKLNDLSIKQCTTENKVSKFDLTFYVNELDSQIDIAISYCTKLFKQSSISMMLLHLENVIKEIIINTDKKIQDINLITNGEIEKIKEFNNTNLDYNKKITIHEMFEKQVSKTPNEIAVVYGANELTYKNLNERANNLAKVMKQKGLNQNQIVAIASIRSADMITAMLAVLKAGGAYMPLDINNPISRTEYMLLDSSAKILLLNIEDKLSDKYREYEDLCKKLNVKLIDIQKDEIYSRQSKNIGKNSNENSLAYVIYTSGTTGNPKGVMIEHRNVINLVYGLNKEIYNQYSKKQRIALIAPVYFDASVKQIYAALLNGHTLYMTSDEQRYSIEKLTSFYIDNEIDITDGTPMHIGMLVGSNAFIENKINVKHYIIGGQNLPLATVKEFFKYNENSQISNVYGPTECCVDTTIKTINKNIANSLDKMTIGYPMPNYHVQILDGNNNQMPIGVPGELCVFGDGVGRGYMNNSELTQKSFICDKFTFTSSKNNEKMYRTGDLARWLVNGEIEYIGRIDDQVKIRGYRIELEEIENKLLEFEDIKDTKVIVKEINLDKQICGYIVSDKQIDISNIISYLKLKLPEYMIPSYIVQLEKMPMTSNGKVDKRALPEPTPRQVQANEYEAPTSDIEKRLCKIFEDLFGVEKIGINDNFFDLGGHSLKAMMLISQIQKEFDKEIELNQVFKAPSIYELVKCIDKQTESRFDEIKCVAKKDHYNVSSAQKRIFVLQQFDIQSTAYNMPMILEIDGKVNKEKIEKVLVEIIKRHETFRTYFELVNEEIIQRIVENVDFVLKVKNIKKSSDKNKNDISKEYQSFIKPFDLGKAPLIRGELVNEGDKSYLLIDMHHIVSDGMSMNLLIKEFSSLYNGDSLEPLKLQYKDYAEWQNTSLQSEQMRKQEEYWLSNLSGELPILNMPLDYERPDIQSFEGDIYNFTIENSVFDKVKQLEKQTGITTHMFMLTAINILLSKYTGQDDIIVGTPVSGRPHADLQNIIGMFVNTLALRNKPVAEKTVQEFIEEVKQGALSAYQNQSYQFDELVEKLNIRKDTSRNPLFDAVLSIADILDDNASLQNINSIQLNDLSIIPYATENKISKFDIVFEVSEKNQDMQIGIQYCTKLFKLSTIQRISKHLENIIKQITENINQQIKDIELVTEEERKQILDKFNDTKTNYDLSKTVIEKFEQQVNKTPNNIAVVCGGKQLTYKELNEKSNSLARVLRQKGIQANDIVGIMMTREIEYIIGVMAIEKAGGAYAPIDPTYPIERISYILDDSKTKVLLHNVDLEDNKYSSLMTNNTLQVEMIDIRDNKLYTGDTSNLKHISSCEDIAYVIYTSGTTGQPKGVMVKHKSLMNISSYHNDVYKANEKDKGAMYVSFSFDVSVWDLWPYLMVGASVHIIKEEIRYDMYALNEYFNKNGITIVFLPSQICEKFMEEENTSLRELLAGADKLNKYKKGCYQLVNNYGPTETAVYVTRYIVNKQENNIPIGKPISNTKLYVVNKYNKLMPVGVDGELCIAGVGLAKGYLNKAELTAEKFVDNPFEAETKMYKTGDLARWLPDGNIEYHGRIDNQVKIRGFRIELEEIQSKILEDKNIKEAVVIIKDKAIDKDDEVYTDKYICAYVVINKEQKNSQTINENTIKERLTEKLPYYMVPSVIIEIDSIPLSTNGKINKKALPEPNISKHVQNYEVPTTKLEKTLCNMFEKILGVTKVGINDNFFELGGHSLMAMTLVSQIHKEMQKDINLNELFKSPTVKGIALILSSKEDSIYSNIAQLDKKEYYETSSAQQRMYMLQNYDKESVSYNIPIFLELEGNVDEKKVQEVFSKLVSRHEAFRTYFEIKDGEIVQKICNEIDFKVEINKDNKKSIEKICTSFVKPFDLSKAPLMRAELVKQNKHTYLLLDIHHIVSDGVSVDILTKEFISLYSGKVLEPLKLQYKDFAAWQNTYLQSDEVKKQEQYWVEQFSDDVPELDLSTDFDRPQIQSYEGDTIHFDIPEKIYSGVKELSKITGTTTNMIMLSVFNILLSKQSRQEDIVIGVSIAGRPHADIQNIIGVFINTLALRNQPKAELTYIEFLNNVKKNSLEAYENQSYQFETLIEKLNIKRDTSRNPLFDVMFSTTSKMTDENIIEDENLRLTSIKENYDVAKFDLILDVIEFSSHMDLSINYCTKLFKQNTIEKMGKQFIQILEQVMSNNNMTLANVQIASDEDIKLIKTFNDTEHLYDKTKTIQEVFEQQVDKSSSNYAIIYGEEKITYKELNKKINSLANKLRNKHSKPDDIVGLICTQSIESIISIFAILKAGLSYLPIDITMPKERIEFMLHDSSCNIILTNQYSEVKEKIDYDGKIIDVSDINKTNLDGEKLENPRLINKSNNLAYIIYTSGTTGQPKGVMVEHRNVVNMSNWFRKEYSIATETNVLQYTKLTFDVSVEEIFGCLLNGATLVINKDYNLYNKEEFTECINKYSINLIQLVPALMQSLIIENEKMESIKVLICGGEALPLHIQNKILEKGYDLYNCYGPTETTVDAITNKCQNADKVVIGKPIYNTKIYILDKNNNIMPIGVPGELCIAGDGVTRGYLNREDLTKEKFLNSPYDQNLMMYRTGDLARWLDSGELEFLGRIDNQVKIRGYRIELEEIQNKILEFKDVKDAVVVVKQKDKTNESDKFICAYITTKDKLQKVSNGTSTSSNKLEKVAFNDTELRNYLKNVLPNYMIPSYIIQIEDIPLTSNGKVNTKALPEPEFTQISQAYEAPRNKTEEIICDIWTDILGAERVGINDNFFDIGGHSLKAMVVISRIQKELGKEITLNQFFTAPTVKDISEYLESDTTDNTYQAIEKVEEKEYYETSSAQKRMYMLQQFEKDSVVYNMPSLFEIEGKTDENKIKEVFKKLVNRHESLRTYFEMVDEEIVQKIDTKYEYDVKVVHDDRPIYSIKNEFIKAFDLGKLPLMRVELIYSNNKTYLFIDMHHIISDGVSMDILTREFIELYDGMKLNTLNIQYKDYAAWQNKYMQTDEMKKQEEYWINQFSDEIPVLDMPLDYDRLATQSFEGQEIKFELTSELSEKVRQIQNQFGMTTHMFMLATINILLSKYSGQDDIVIGTPVLGRTHADLQNIIGMFVNTLALRNKPVSTKTIKEFMQEVKKNSLNAYQNQSYQFDGLVEKISVKRDSSRNPLFDVMLNVNDTVSINEDNYNIIGKTEDNKNNSTNINELSIKPFVQDSRVSKFDMTVYVSEKGEKIEIGIEYCTKLFKESTIQRFIKHLQNTINHITENVDQQIKDIELLTEDEKSIIINNFNNTQYKYDDNKNIQQIFEEQVEKVPDKTAIVYKDTTLTYRELNNRVNQVANMLREKGIKSNNIVAIMVERNIEMLVGVLGIIKSGAAYLPIDVNYPVDRIELMLTDSNANILLTKSNVNHNTINEIKQIKQNLEIINLDEEKIYKQSTKNPKNFISPKDLAYIIYTSGSTGKPKGVMLQHSNLLNLIYVIQEKFPIGKDEAYLLKTNYTFDVSISEIFGWFMGQGKLVILENGEEKEAKSLLETISKNKVTHVNFVPSMARMFFDYISEENKDKMKCVKYILLAGEVFEKDLAEKIKNITNQYNTNIGNLYGPTETTVYSTGYIVGDIEELSSLPIGKPLININNYIVNEQVKLQPIGVWGELCISGKGVAKGYLNREELTNEKFIDNPFDKTSKLYKTGDIARWLPDGNIEIKGRNDNQIKIRGFRIELGEIKNRILQNKDVKLAEVIVTGKGIDKSICAYVVSEKTIEELDLKSYLKQKLPEYMIPTHFVQIDEMPMTTSGKINRKALPEPKLNRNINKYEAPINETEKKLCAIFERILGVERVGVNDSFFDLGGHSLKAMTLVSQIHKEFNKEILIKEVFEKSTVKEISKHIENIDENIYDEIKIIEEKEYYETSAIQKRMYLVQAINKESTAYNIPMVFEIKDSVNIDKIKSCLYKLVQRHEILRTHFEQIDGEIVQKIDTVDCFIIDEETSNDDVQQKFNDFCKPFDLSNSSLMRVKIMYSNDKKYLFIDFHHIVADAVSNSILLHEFISLCNDMELEPNRIQYKDFAVWHNSVSNSQKIQQQEAYWLSVFEDTVPVLDLPTDYERPAIQDYESNLIEFSLKDDIMHKIQELRRTTGTTYNMIILAAFNILLSKYSGQEDIVIGMPIAGRTNADVQNIIGAFINTLAIRNKPNGEKTYLQFLNEVKTNTLNAYENQDYQFDSLIEKLHIRRETSRNPLFDVMVNMINVNDKSSNTYHEIGLVPLKMDLNSTKFDITLTIIESDEKLNFSFDYKSRLFKKETIEKFIKHLSNIFEIVLDNVNIKIEDISMLSKEEEDIILYKFNDTYLEYDKSLTLKDMFEQQVEKTPDNIALVFGGKPYTYKELNERANSLAYVLREKGVKPDTIVGIMVDRSARMMIGILAIIKSGGAYLPIDPEYPIDRVQYMLEDSGCKLLLSLEEAITKVQFSGETIDIFDENIYESNKSNIETLSSPENLAYVIYTSGTTGKPKGVMIEQRNVVNFVYAITEKTNIHKYTNVLNITTMCFDIFNLETIVPLTQGMKVVISGNKEQNDSEQLSQIIETQNIDVMQSTPSRIDMLMENKLFAKSFARIKLLLVGGEKVQDKTISKLRDYDSMTIYNVYGPTETTIWSTAKQIMPNEKILIGKPIGNTQIYVLNNKKKIVPIGVAGEMCIAGDGLARGYLNREDLTNEKFIQNPYKPDTKMYKTGDLVRWLDDGNIDFLGRMDNQVKVRGYRIELGEIENRLIEHENISDAVVLAKNNNMHLCAYIVCDKELPPKELKEYLRKSLPVYMVPNQFIKLDKIPMTPNGKVDRNTLLKMKIQRDDDKKVKPRSLQEYTIVEIWSEVLGIDEIYVDDDFFELGGNSINVVTIANKIHEKLEVDIDIATLMTYTTVVDLAEHLIEMSCIEGQKKYKHLFKINKSKSEKNIFIIHGADSDIFYYRELAKILEPEYSVYGIQPKGLTGKENLPESFYEMDRDYMEEIRQLQPHGPYIIAGYCVGGYMCYDLTRLLEIQGDETTALIEIDQEPFVTDKLANLCRSRDYALRVIDFIRRITFRDKSYTLRTLTKLFEKKYVVTKERQMEIISSRQAIHKYYSVDLLPNCNYAYYGRKVKRTPTIVIKAYDNEEIKFKTSTWEKMTNDLTYHEVPGGHETILLQPYIQAVGEIILTYLHDIEDEKNKKKRWRFGRKKNKKTEKQIPAKADNE